jgi:hypothetical protein
VKCPYCRKIIHLETMPSPAARDELYRQGAPRGWDVAVNGCPACRKPIVLLCYGTYFESDPPRLVKTLEQKVIWPTGAVSDADESVPKHFAQDHTEAAAIASLSPRASAALSRRVLQHVIRERYGIHKRNLEDEIEEFIEKAHPPSHLAKALDAVRQIGNFAAHPMKNTSTGEIVEVEPGEADWLLEVLEQLFDFAYVHPLRTEERKRRLNDKLKALGKPALKE